MSTQVTFKFFLSVFLLIGLCVDAQENIPVNESESKDVVMFTANRKSFNNKKDNGFLDEKKSVFLAGTTHELSYDKIKEELTGTFPKEYMYEGYPKVSIEKLDNQEVIKFQNIHLENTEKILTTTYYKKATDKKTIAVALTCPLKIENKYSKTIQEAISTAQIQ